MSMALNPPEHWPEKIFDARIPANNNALRLEIFNTDGVADDVTAQPSLATPADDGKWYIIPSGATGTQWATFAEDSIAIFYGGTWYEFVPAEGAKVSVAGVPLIFTSGAWAPFVAPSGAAWGAITGTLSSQTDLAAALAAKAGTTQADECMSGLIVAPADGDYRIVVKAPHGGTITETTTVSASGTCTLTFKINTTALGGTANSVSSSEQSQAHSSSNVFAAGDDIVLTISSNATCSKMTFTIKYSRTLA